MEGRQEAEEKWRNHWLNKKKERKERRDRLWQREGEDMDEKTAVGNGVCSYGSLAYGVGT